MSVTEDNRIADVVALAAPGTTLDQKSKHLVFRLIGKLVPNFLRSFWTTIPDFGDSSTIYRPSSTDVWAAPQEYAVIAHEVQHVMQTAGLRSRFGSKLGTVVYALSYLFPQLLAFPGLLWFLLWLLTFGSVPFWPCLLLIAGAPWPAYWRTKLELEAYKVSAAVRYWYSGGMTEVETSAWTDSVSKYFTDSSYYWMAWRRGAEIKAAFQAWFHDLTVEAPSTKTAYLQDVKKLVDRYRAEDSTERT